MGDIGGDRAAIVAAETLEIANQALALIEVDYEILPVIVDMEAAMQLLGEAVQAYKGAATRA